MLEQQFNRLLKIGPRFLNGVTLAGHIHLWAKRHKPIVLTLDDGGEFPAALHGSTVIQRRPRVNDREKGKAEGEN